MSCVAFLHSATKKSRFDKVFRVGGRLDCFIVAILFCSATVESRVVYACARPLISL